MDRRSRHRIGKCKELLSAALKERDERLKQFLQVGPTYARRHAAAVAAIVLSGRPRIDEPLKRAWARALQHYGIDVNTDQIAAAQRLLPIIKGDGKESARFTERFRTTPVWLLQFTGMASCISSARAAGRTNACWRRCARWYCRRSSGMARSRLGSSTTRAFRSRGDIRWGWRGSIAVRRKLMARRKGSSLPR